MEQNEAVLGSVKKEVQDIIQYVTECSVVRYLFIVFEYVQMKKKDLEEMTDKMDALKTQNGVLIQQSQSSYVNNDVLEETHSVFDNFPNACTCSTSS